MSSGGVGRVRAKLALCMARADFYEAHQMYRTLHFRLMAKKSYNDLLELLHSGAVEFLKHGQQQSGVDLAILYVDVLLKSKMPVDNDIVEKLSNLFSSINPSIPERETFLANSVRWSMGEKTFGDPILHKNIALTYQKEQSYQNAQHHFFHSDDGLLLAGMLLEMHATRGSPDEFDSCIASAVLQILCKKRKELARDTFLYYVGLHPSILNKTGPPYKTDLLNFIWFLLEAVDTKNVNVFKELLVKYDESISREPLYTNYLRKIAKIWFDILTPKTNMQKGIFGNLIQTLLSGMEGDDSIYDEETTNQSTQNRMQTEDVE